MSYLVLARKWRPLSFDDVVGQEHITSTLARAIEKNRVAHAYIFTGTRGVGKTTTARILARALNCDKGPTPSPCGECESCQNIIKGSSFDVIEIDGASNNGVDHIRELRENVSYTSMGGKFRIFVIDEVHMLTKGAFNALLKTLEEPPKNVIFIFATTEPQKIPETIHSRCQRYDFRRISSEHIVGQLEKICEQEAIPFEKNALKLVGHKADGSMRDALSLMDQVLSFCKEGIVEEEVRSVLGLVETELYTSIIAAIQNHDPLPVLQAINDILERGFDLNEFITGFQEYIRTLLFARLPGALESQLTDLSLEHLKKQSDLASQFSEGDLLRMAEVLRKAESDLKWSTYPRFLVETAILKLVYMDSTVTVQQVLQSIQRDSPAPAQSVSDKKKTSLVDDPHPKQPIEPSKPVVAASSQTPLEEDSFKPLVNTNEPVDLLALWPKFIEKLVEDRPSLGSFMSMAHIAETTEESIDLRFKGEFSFQFAEVTKKSNRDVISKKLSSFVGKNILLHITIEKNNKPKSDVKTKLTNGNTHRHPSLEDDMANEPILKKVIEIFDGEIL